VARFPKALALIILCAAPLHGQWNLCGYLGGAKTHNSSITVDQPALGNRYVLRDVSWRGESFRGPLYYGFRGGYFTRGDVGFEGEFTHLKVFANTEREVEVQGTVSGAQVNERRPMNSLVQRFSISHGMNLLLANLAARRQFRRHPDDNMGRLLLTGRAGFGVTLPHPETEIGGASVQHYQWGRPAWQLAGGTELRLRRGLYWVFEYKFSHTRQRVRVASGQAETPLRTHHGVFGLCFNF
jgi:hypothetical protein